MILSGQEIAARLGGDVKIEPYNPAALNPNSYNLTLHDEEMVYEEVILDMDKANRVRRIQIPREGHVHSPKQINNGRTDEST